jgi:3-oxoacyl-[acyl-carrier protein] reductase
MDLGIRGKTALVLGGNRGIGRGIAQALADEGVNVAITGRDISRGDAAATEIAARSKTKTAFFALDLSDTASLKPTADRIGAEFGPVDILVNNTGGPDYGGASSRDLQEWSDRFQDMVVSVIALTDAILPGMRQRKWGRIVNISSGAARGAGAIGVHYNASKAGMEGLTRGYAARLVKEGITVNAVAPSLIETDMMRGRSDLARNIPLGRLGRSPEVAQSVLMVLGNDYMTGQTVLLNGGMAFI